VEIKILIEMYMDLIDVLQNSKLLSMVAFDNLTFPCYQKMLMLLRPWSSYLDLNCTSHTDSLDKDQIDHIIYYFALVESNIGVIHQHRNEFLLAEDHLQRALSYARMYEGEEEVKTHLLCSTLRSLYTLHRDQENFTDTLAFAEESYNCAAVAYNPVHPVVQDAASTLIECLILKDNFYDAERFAEATLDSLMDPANGLDQQSEAVAKGYYDLGNVINQQKGGGLLKSEILVRESLRIRTSLYDDGHTPLGDTQVAMSTILLASILHAQGNLGSETKELYKRSLVSIIKNYGPEGLNTAVRGFKLGNFYHCRANESQAVEMRKEDLLLSKSKYKEALRINTKVLGPDNPRTKEVSSSFSLISRKLSEV
jgi:hypothetical protein